MSGGPRYITTGRYLYIFSITCAYLRNNKYHSQLQINNIPPIKRSHESENNNDRVFIYHNILSFVGAYQVFHLLSVKLEKQKPKNFPNIILTKFKPRFSGFQFTDMV